jgi:hypothetical protein
MRIHGRRMRDARQWPSAWGGGRMKRLLAIFVFLASGFAVEVVHPIHCSLVPASRTQAKRRKE